MSKNWNRWRRESEGQAETIGQRLRRLRHERGLSQRELAGPASRTPTSRGSKRAPGARPSRRCACSPGSSASPPTTSRPARRSATPTSASCGSPTPSSSCAWPTIRPRPRAKLERLRDEAVGRRGRRRRVAREHRARPRCRRRGPQRGRDRAARGRARAVAGLARAPGRTCSRRSARRTRPAARSTSRRGVRAQPRRGRRGRTRGRRRAGPVHHLPQLRADRPRATSSRAAGRSSTRLSSKADALTDAYSRVRLYWGLARLNDVGGPAGRGARLRPSRDRAAGCHRRHAAPRPRAPALRRHPDGAGSRRGGRPQLRPRRAAASGRTPSPRISPASAPTRPGERCSWATATRLAAGQRGGARSGRRRVSARAGERPLGAGARASRSPARRTPRTPRSGEATIAARDSTATAATTSRRTGPGASSCDVRAARRRRSRCSSAPPISPPSRVASDTRTPSGDLRRGSAAGPVLPSRHLAGTRATRRAA